MSSTKSYTGIRDFLKGITLLDVVEWDSLDQNMTQRTASFLAIEELDSAERTLSVGSPQQNWLEEEGEMAVHVFSPANEGFTTARPIGDSVQEGLRHQHLPNNVRVYNVSPPTPGFIANGLWSSMIVVLTYRHQYQAPTFVA